MDFLCQLFSRLLGQDDATIVTAVASFIQFMYGAALIFVLDLSFRDPESSRTPSNFKVDFLWYDNRLRLIRTILIGMLFLITGSTIVAITGVMVPPEWGNVLPVFAGMSSDGIALMLKRKFIQQHSSVNEFEPPGN